MRSLLAPLSAVLMTLGSFAGAQSMTVVELYTSQGCSSCPPADKFLHELAKQDDVIALALHVDYWDYIGWKDEFARPHHTERQKAYARVAGSRTVYTPQMVIGGVDHVIGTRPQEVAATLTKHMMADTYVEISGSRTANTVTLEMREVVPVDGAMVVQLVTYNPSASVDIKRGENAGKTLNYTNIVTSWTALEAWNGDAPLTLEAEVPNDDPAVVIVQMHGHGRIVGAVRLD